MSHNLHLPTDDSAAGPPPTDNTIRAELIRMRIVAHERANATQALIGELMKEQRAVAVRGLENDDEMLERIEELKNLINGEGLDPGLKGQVATNTADIEGIKAREAVREAQRGRQEEQRSHRSFWVLVTAIGAVLTALLALFKDLFRDAMARH